jgi:aminopeptidase N
VREVDPGAIHEARDFLRRGLAEAHREALETVYGDNLQAGPYTTAPEAMGRRKLRNTALAYLTRLPEAEYRQVALEQFNDADNMTDTMAALSALSHTEGAERLDALHRFYQNWHHEPLVLDKWFSIQAMAPLPGTFNRVVALREHPDFNIKNPNRVRALVGAFCQGNPSQFHREDGAGYTFLADFILELDRLNPQVAARLMNPFTQWKRLEPVRRERMHRELERIAGSEGISRDVYEIASKSLAG